jgi:predicted nucleic acid-binding protein
MTYLLDLNVLIALAWPSHVHHCLAQAWFKRHRHQGWATCPLTPTGFALVKKTVFIGQHIDASRRFAQGEV